MRKTACLRARLGGFIRLLGGLLRELGDESAYHRHLTAHGCEHSREEWHRFSDQRFKTKYLRPKCC